MNKQAAVNDQVVFERVPDGPGVVEVISPGNSASDGIELAFLRVEPGQREQVRATDGCETVLVVLSGRCDVTVGITEWKDLDRRSGVFDGPATAVYIPVGNAYEVRADEATEIAVYRIPAQPMGDAYVVTPDEVKVEQIGQAVFEREAHTIMLLQRPWGSIAIGETFSTRDGGWASYPPHKHESHEPPDEWRIQEVRHYRVDPPQGFGIVIVYSPERGTNEAFMVHDGDNVLISYGYHPTVAAPGYCLYFLWCLAGNGPGLDMTARPYREDPAHSWVRQ